MDEEIKRAMWEGDLDKLQELAPCGCCCYEHFSENCPARVWDGCRGSGMYTTKEIEAWRAFYGMSRKQFYNEDE